MPRFFFDLTNGSGTARDEEGAELAGLPEARAYAIHCARDIAGTDIREGRGASLGSFVTIRDAQSEIERVTFAQALGITA